MVFLSLLSTVALAASPLWTANHETGDLSQWYFPDPQKVNHGGGKYNSGIADSVASQEQAHSGKWSAKLSITTPSKPTSGTRLFRWKESHEHPRLYYSAWYYFPLQYAILEGWWNIMQWKSKTATTNDPFFVVNVGQRPDGAMYLYLFDWQKRITYNQSAKDIPVRKWFRIEAYYKCTGDGTGRVTIWQDGTLLIDVDDVRTRYANGDCQWSVNNYSSSLFPNPATIYIDDCAISTSR